MIRVLVVLFLAVSLLAQAEMKTKEFISPVVITVWLVDQRGAVAQPA